MFFVFSKDLHPYDIHLFWADVSERVKQQVFAECFCFALWCSIIKTSFKEIMMMQKKIDVSSFRFVVRVGTWSVLLREYHASP